MAYQPFFELLDIKTNLIYANTPAKQYSKGGINFSDASNLSLMRNKASVDGKSALVRADKKEERACCLDEADQTYYDSFNRRYNYSVEANESLTNMVWIYPLLVEFFENSTHQDLYYDDIDRCDKAFLNFAKTYATPDQYTQLQALYTSNKEQIETWHTSAVTAMNLRFNDHFGIALNQKVLGTSGPKIASLAGLLVDGRIDTRSKFSLGVQQCLHVRLNKLMTTSTVKAEDQDLKRALTECEKQFPVDPEKQIIYSSTSRSLLDEYEYITGVSGTTGSLEEQKELSDTRFIHVPRHNGLHRDDYIKLVKKDRDRLKTIAKSIKEARKKGQPVLVICKNDTESEELYNELKTLYPSDEAVRRLSATSFVTHEGEEKFTNEKVGIPGAITVSTKMIGRGTDIKLHGNAKKHGLHVILTHIPETRDYLQVIGRAGRFGDNGSSQLILSREELSKRLAGSMTRDINYNTIIGISRYLQRLENRHNQIKRKLKAVIEDYRDHITKTVFKTDDVFARPWAEYNEHANREFGLLWAKISDELNQAEPSKDNINYFLQGYQEKLNRFSESLSLTEEEKLVFHKTLSFDGQIPVLKRPEDYPLPEKPLSRLMALVVTEFKLNPHSMKVSSTVLSLVASGIILGVVGHATLIIGIVCGIVAASVFVGTICDYIIKQNQLGISARPLIKAGRSKPNQENNPGTLGLFGKGPNASSETSRSSSPGLSPDESFSESPTTSEPAKK